MSLTHFARPQHHQHTTNKIFPRVTSSIKPSEQYDITRQKTYQRSLDLLEDDIVRARVHERSLIHRYNTSDFTPTYSPDYVRRLTRAAVSRAEQNLIRSRAALQLQSPLNDVKTINTEQILKNLHSDKKNHRDIDEDRLERIAHHEYLIFKHHKDKIERNNKKEFSDDMKRLLRGKSPKSIAQALLAEAENNIKEAKKEEDTFMIQAKRSLRTNLSNPNQKQPYIPLYKIKMLKNK